jgi:hypothetical protein
MLTGGVLSVAAFVLLTTLLASPTVQAAEDPPMVRGDQRNGEVATDLTWSERVPALHGRQGSALGRQPADIPSLRCLSLGVEMGPECGGSPVPAGSTPEELALHAAGLLRLPLPQAEVRPMVRFADGAVGGLTGAPMWLWMHPAHWSTLRQRTQVGPVWAEVTARPVLQTWYFGDGSGPLLCEGPGTPLTDTDQALEGSPDCGYRYTVSSGREPGGRYVQRVVVTWQVSWVGSGDTGGILAPMHRQQLITYAVRQARAELIDPA